MFNLRVVKIKLVLLRYGSALGDQAQYAFEAPLTPQLVEAYELFVGQPPFYTNSVYALIRHNIVKDPVKYPDDMSPNFKPMNYPQELRLTTDAARGCDAAWKGEGQMANGLIVFSSKSKNNSPAACEKNTLHNDAEMNWSNRAQVSSSPHEEFPGFASPGEVKPSGR
ncbi:hypothetical protein Q3G72_001542 [Acer saccharum]|nr:hypothetical protein Q3G72_001542 [Acer saccharum]